MWINLALVLVDLHGVFHLRQRRHVGVAGLSLLTVKLLFIELLYRGGRGDFLFCPALWWLSWCIS